jgi:hypothetical protein
MTGCQCKSGFFTLRDCEEIPIKACGACGRMMCAHHTSPASGFVQCLDCWARGEHERKREAREGDEEEDLTADESDEELDSDWTYTMRHGYYAAGYRPLYSGHDRFDEYDVRSFDRSADEDWDADEGGGGFGDS